MAKGSHCMADICAVINQKGGVGKTATSYNLAYALSNHGKKVLLVDMDPSRNATKPFVEDGYQYSINSVLADKNFDPNNAIIQSKIRGEFVENLYIIPSHISLAMLQYQIIGRAHKEKLLARQLDKIKHNYDYIIIDCPPMLSEFTTNAIYAANNLWIPIKYEKDALDGIQDLFNIVSEIKENDYYDYKMLRNSKNATKKKIIDLVESSLSAFGAQGHVFNTVIRQDEDINLAKADDETIFTYSPNSRGAQDFATLAKEIIDG